MRRIRRNEQPIARFHFVGLRTYDRLPAVFAGNNAILILEILTVGDLSAEDHLAGAAGKNVKIVGASVLLGIIPNAVDLGQTQDRLLPMGAIEHKHAEVARGNVDGPAAKGLRTSTARFFQHFGGSLGHFSV